MQHYIVERKNNKIILKENDFHHIKNVMRIKSGENIACIVDNQKYLSKITYSNNDYQIQLLEKLESNELNKNIHLFQVLIKNDKFDLIIQKASELGVSDIHPTFSKRCIIKLDEKEKVKKIDRYNKIIKEACEQSERNNVVQMHDFIDLKDIVLPPSTLGLLFYERDNDSNSLNKALENINNYKDIYILIGPEGGFDESEVNILLKKGFKMVSLGKRILRAETAAISSISILSYIIGDN